jgi:4-amino-4-deoxy-L-arabinose transferase-like glycosyltransferase
VLLVALLGALIRLWQIGSLGFNSDEAVYAGQAASIAGKADYLPYFPIFRAHPLLYQSLLSVIYRVTVSDVAGRALTVVFGVATLVVVYALGRLLYGPRAGIVAMLLLAVMPYHVIVTRQVLLDGPMVFFATLALWLLVKYCVGQGAVWLVAAAAVMGLAVLTKETAVVLVAGVYMFFMLTHVVKVRAALVAWSLAAMAAVALAFPLAIALAGASHRGSSYLAWQLFRKQNHPFDFYLTTVPFAIGVAVVACAIGGLVIDRHDLDWREWLLCTWAIAPIVFFTLTPLKGFQYLLPVAPVAAVLAARALTAPGLWDRLLRRVPADRRGMVQAGVLVAVVLSLLLPSWSSVQPSTSRRFLAGSGGLPGGREAGTWIKENLPEGATLLTLGPSMANVVQFYGHRQAYGLSVSPNPLNRNPSYVAIDNADLQLRSGSIQYAVWDSFSAGRSPSFSRRLLAYVAKYHGVVIHTQTVAADGPDGRPTAQPVIRVFEVLP